MHDTHPVPMGFTVAVEYHAGDKEPLQFNINPKLPGNSFAVIQWVVSPNSPAFDFVEFEWCDPKCPIAEPLVHGPCMTALVSNRKEPEVGRWEYRVGIRLAGSPDVIHSKLSVSAPEDANPHARADRTPVSTAYGNAATRTLHALIALFRKPFGRGLGDMRGGRLVPGPQGTGGDVATGPMVINSGL